MVGLHLGAVAALTAVAAASLVWGAGFELLKIKQGSGHWVFIALWLLAAALIALPQRAVAAWKCGLAAFVGVCCIAAVLGLWRGAPLALGVAVSLAVLALGAAAAARAVSEHRVKRTRTRSGETVKDSATVLPVGGVDTDLPPLARVRRAVGLNGVLWWSWALLFVQAFRCAHTGDAAAVRGVGHAAMLLSFFVMLPALCVSRWWPRPAAAAWGVAAALWLALAAHTPMGWTVAAAAGSAILALSMANAPHAPRAAVDDEAMAA
ncbi:MAG: hypothetical protein H0W48_08045 [Methylibium sp.]|nr:hypothetical protein [Methylibium sp.]